MFITEGVLSSAQQFISPHYHPRPTSTEIDLLVIHCISLPAGIFGNGLIQAVFLGQFPVDRYPSFASLDKLKVSAHLVIDRQGEITQYVNLNDAAWHAGESRFKGKTQCNDFSIGIELEGAPDVPYTDIQYNVLKELIFQLQTTYPGITSDRIVGHSHIAPGRKTDPGTAFEWERLK